MNKKDIKKTKIPSKTESQKEVVAIQKPSKILEPREDTLTRIGHFMHGQKIE